MSHESFADVPTAIEEVRAGRMIVVVDDEDRENEGDITLAAEKVTPEAINFMAKYGRGLVCLAMTEERLDHLRIGPMTRREHFAIRHCILRGDRRARRRDYRHLCLRSRAHHPSRHRSRDASLGPGAPRPRLPASRPQRRSARPRRTDRSLRRSRPPRWTDSRRNHLRNHEGRWHHGPRPRPNRVLPRNTA